MVDHRADDDQGLRFLLNSQDDPAWDRRGFGDWLRSLLSTGRTRLFDRHAPSAHHRFGDLFRTNRLAVALSLIWTGVLIAYGIGYFTRLDGGAGGTSALPTMDLVFFVFAIVGPVVMLWFAVAMLNRAAHLSEAIAGQSESALALATTVTNLNDSVDALAMGTTGRLEQACDRMEREASAAVTGLDKSLKETSEKLETALLDGVILLDRNLRERSDSIGRKLDEQQTGIDAELRQRISKVQDTLEAEGREVVDVQRKLAARVDAGLAETAKRMNRAIRDLAEQQRSAVVAVSESSDETAKALLAQIGDTFRQQIDLADAKLKSANEQLAASAKATNDAIQNDLGASVNRLNTEMTRMRESVVANPPATAEELAALMGEAVHRIISPERTALTQSVLRIEALEERVGRLLEGLDRTSRLAPVLDAEQRTAPKAEAPENDLFGDLPQQQTRANLNWSAVIHVLNQRDAVPGTQDAVRAILSDPDIADLIRMRDAILNALAEHGLFAEDIAPEHARAEVWVAWAEGQRDRSTAVLAGIRDEISNAIARGWLRQSSLNQVLTLRFLQTYQRLLNRAIADLGADGRIVELADTSAGRAFVLLGGLNSVFDQGTLNA